MELGFTLHSSSPSLFASHRPSTTRRRRERGDAVDRAFGEVSGELRSTAACVCVQALGPPLPPDPGGRAGGRRPSPKHLTCPSQKQAPCWRRPAGSPLPPLSYLPPSPLSPHPHTNFPNSDTKLWPPPAEAVGEPFAPPPSTAPPPGPGPRRFTHRGLRWSRRG